eukprot:3424203-Rhodomonas_salina.1
MIEGREQGQTCALGERPARCASGCQGRPCRSSSSRTPRAPLSARRVSPRRFRSEEEAERQSEL